MMYRRAYTCTAFLAILLVVAPGVCLAAQASERARAARAEGGKPFVFQSNLITGKKAGDLVLGRTTFDEALAMYPVPPFNPYDGDLRPVESEYPSKSGDVLPKARFVYNPWQTMYTLFFDEDRRLVIISELFELGSFSEKELLHRYPTLSETSRSASSTEYQAEIQQCVTLIAFSGNDSVQQISYAYTCE